MCLLLQYLLQKSLTGLILLTALYVPRTLPPSWSCKQACAQTAAFLAFIFYFLFLKAGNVHRLQPLFLFFSFFFVRGCKRACAQTAACYSTVATSPRLSRTFPYAWPLWTQAKPPQAKPSQEHCHGHRKIASEDPR